MKSRPDNPRQLDVEGFAKGAVVLQGELALRDLLRLLDMAHADALPGNDGSVPWRAEGEARADRGSAPEIWLHLQADTALSMVCQRCLNAVAVPVQVARSFRFVVGADAAAQLDAEIDDDVLDLPRTLDLHELVEDELLLALPLVPRHAVCPDPLRAPDAGEVFEERPNPFAALGALKRGGQPN